MSGLVPSDSQDPLEGCWIACYTTYCLELIYHRDIVIIFCYLLIVLFPIAKVLATFERGVPHSNS